MYIAMECFMLEINFQNYGWIFFLMIFLFFNYVLESARS